MATRQIISDPIGAYAQDEANASLDQANVGNIRGVSNVPQFDSKDKTHKISKGDSASKIAKKYGLKLEELLAANPELAKNPDKVSIGTKISIPRKADINAAKEQQLRSDADFYKQGGVGTPIEDESVFSKIKNYVSRIPGNIATEGKKALEQAGDIPGKVGEFIKENPSLVGAAANVAGGVGGYMMGQQATDEAFKNVGRARKGYEEVQQQVQGIKPNQELIEARKAAIQGIKQRSEMGLTPEDQAMLRQVQAQQLRQGAAGRQAAEEAATRRGAQGGQDIMAALQGAGQAQQIASEQADRLASTSFQAKQQALKDLATASQTGITGDFAQDLARAREAADIEKDIGATYGTEAKMQQDKAAQLAGLGQSIGEAVSNPLSVYAQTQKDRMANTPAPEQKTQTPADKLADNLKRPELKTQTPPVKKDKSVASQASAVINKTQGVANKVQKTVSEAQKAAEQFKNLSRAFGQSGIPFRK